MDQQNETLDGIRAWRAFGGALEDPSLVDSLDPESTKSRILRFPEGRAGGSGVIAKLAPKDVIRLERRIYTEILPGIGLPSIRCLGTGSSGLEGRAWLFLEEVKGILFDPYDGAHVRALTEAVALLHRRTATSAVEFAVPLRGREYLAALLGRRAESMTDRLSEARSEADAGVVRRMLGIYERLVGEWPRYFSVLEEAAPVLVHGDLGPENLRIMGENGGCEVRILDWEKAGIGPRALDLAHVDLDEYRQALGSGGERPERKRLEAEQILGKIIGIATRRLFPKPLKRLERYVRKTEELLHRLEQTRPSRWTS